LASVPLMELSELTVSENGQTVIDGVSLRLSAGEIFGIAGVDGNGQAELVETLAGLRLPVRGTIHSNERISVIPQNRDLDGLILNMELQENLLLSEPLRQRFTGYGAARVIRRLEAMTFASSVIDRFKIRAPGPRAQVAALSGGNRQRLLVARALETGSRIIVAHNVTRGLDPAATASVHRLFEEFAAKGNCVMLISSDLDELLDRCDRLAVMSRGRVIELPRERWTAEQLGLMIAGQSAEQE